MIAALYADHEGCYSGLDNVDLWGGIDGPDGSTVVYRDARDYDGPHPVVAHPPCKRWGRYATGSLTAPKSKRLGADGGCFAAALTAARNFGGVLEHPKDSAAWDWFGLMKPPPTGGWIMADSYGGWTCCVDQGHYGHFSNKRTWLYAVGCQLPSLVWGKGAQKIHPRALELHGYEKARRIGMIAMVGGKEKTRIRNATPPDFRDVLISMAESVNEQRKAA